jgi:hypothetical protein
VSTTKKLLGYQLPNVFSPREIEILTTRALREDPEKANGYHSVVKIKDIKDTFADWRVYGHIVAAFLSM